MTFCHECGRYHAAPECAAAVKLNELDKLEWRDVFMSFFHEATEGQFEAKWAEFQRAKQQRLAQ